MNSTENQLLIELLESLENNDKETRDILLMRCLNASSLELKEFFDELSDLISQYPDIYMTALKTFLSYIYEQSSFNNVLSNFVSMLITIVMISNLHYSDIPEFKELFHLCIEILWKVSDDKTAIQTTERVFSEILDAYGVFNVWISDRSGRHCIKRIFFNFKMIEKIDSNKVLRAVDMIASLMENCSDHKNDKAILPERLSEYKACTELLETLRSYQNTQRTALMDAKNNSYLPELKDMIKLDKNGFEIQNLNRGYGSTKPVMTSKNLPLTIQDKQNLVVLGMEAPRKSSELINFLRVLEQRKIDLFKVLIEFLPCENCYRRALVYFSPDKYSSFANENEFAEIDYSPILSERRLPFEFSDNDNLGPWDVLLSEDAINDMRSLESPRIIKAVMKKFGHISSGKWDELQQRIVNCSSVDVYEMVLPDQKGLKILWQVDCRFSARMQSLAQVVKIWTVTANQEQIREVLENLEIVHQVYTMEHKQQCITYKNKDGIILPRTFENEILKSTDDGLNDHQIDDEKLIKVHKMLVTNKFIPLSKNLFKSIVLGGSGFTFQVSEDEYKIIKYPTSSIIVGRSGTGKTTCIIFRLIASYLMKSSRKLYKTPSLYNNVIAESVSNKRQIFITVSPTLCTRVKEYFNRLRESAMLAEKKMSFNQFYEYVRKKEEESNDKNQSDDLVEEDDEKKMLDDIPNSFKLSDDHFPLFITNEKFSQMLEGTYGIDVNKLWMTKQQDFVTNDVDEDEKYNLTSSSVDTSEKVWAHSVTFGLFREKYWNRLCRWRQDLDPALVFAEFSIIKGSNPEVEYLSREEYLSVNTKIYPKFYDRNEIYDLFERYEKMKKFNYDYDSIDRTRAVLRCAKRKALDGLQIDEIYIDECQDNQIVDLSLILKLFDRVDSIFLAGDTAQCIARGSSFRFQSVRSLIFKWELFRSQTNPNWNGTLKPQQFELNTNYRSHNGILRLASSVIELLERFFPESIDKLPQERGEIGGPRPLIFKGYKNFETFILNYFSVSEQSGDPIEFGAEQVIIVRDEKTQTRLKSNEPIKKACQILTIFEAKGMEFNDVLLYNFFTESPAGEGWGLILSAIEGFSGYVRAFSYERHYILSSELKHLYVAVTRAREHIWIFDENSELSNPIWEYWDHRGLIKVKRNGDGTPFPNLAKKSSVFEWNKKGRQYFGQRQYEQAIYCFEKSRNVELLNLSNAYLLRQVARSSIHDSSNDIVKLNFIKAAESFQKCSRPNQAASCYQDIGMYEKAGDVYVEWEIFESAADCYFKAKIWKKAGLYYEKVKKYSEAVVAYKNGEFYDTVVDLMQRYRKNIDDKTFRRVSRLVNIHYCREDNKEMSEKALEIIPTQEERVEFLADHAPKKLLEVYEKNKQFRDAGKFLRSCGKFEEAASKFSLSADHEDIIESLNCLLHAYRAKILSNMKCMNSDTPWELQNLLYKANNIVSSKSSRTLKKTKEFKILIEEIQLYSAYLANDLNRIYKCVQFFQKNEAPVLEFRAVNVWLQIPKSKIHLEYWHERLQYILRLCELAFPFIAPHKDVINIEKIRKDFEGIFFISEVNDRPMKRKIPADSPLLDLINEMYCKNKIENAEEVMDEQHLYNVNDVHLIISQFLASYIFELLENAHHIGRAIPDVGSKICHEFASSGKCFTSSNKYQRCHDSHIRPTPKVLYDRLMNICFQYTVMRKMLVLYHRRILKEDQSLNVLPRQRYWAERLVDHLFRCQSPQTNCSEVSYNVIRNHLNYTRKGFIDLAHKVWLRKGFKNGKDFGVMLKCMFVFQQLRDNWSIKRFDWVVKNLYPYGSSFNSLIGFEYDRIHLRYISVGIRLSSFFFNLNLNNVVVAIRHAAAFIHYAINNIQQVNIMKTPEELKMSEEKEREREALSDLTSLIEFMMSLIFSAHPGSCDFCLPQSYFVNYFYSYNVEPLLPIQYGHNKYNTEDYRNAIVYSFNLFMQLLYKLDFTDSYHFPIILRMIRLLVLIGLNEFIFESKILDHFNRLRIHVSNVLDYCKRSDFNGFTSEKIKRYLDDRHMGRLVKTLISDLKETGCDSLVVIYYRNDGISKFTEQVKNGAKILNYSSSEEFKSSLWKIVSPVANERKAVIGTYFSCNEDEIDEQNDVSKDSLESATKIQAWFQKINESTHAKEMAKKIQNWFRRQKSRIYVRDTTQYKIYNDMIDFCQNKSHWEDALKLRGKKVVLKYIILLRGLTVDVIVELDKMEGELDSIRNKLKKLINSRASNYKTIETCIDLEDDLRSDHFEDVKGTLRSLSTTENQIKHKEADIKWLKNELQKANDIICKVLQWIDKCKVTVP
ncbi:p-loop containing nucleoside triphosphate hydrolase protein [Gigaspora margarita]|uniref:p-loop containing nucleoside triphosphate hydrolase protein n=1 Tax=Gigaspora margarita TaxID=4874 RepID=A0A8H4B0N3_GIGMA|nr:p-loop containing nucleoside triphosphate hydrolase protein [Gigaspora margarita]